MDATLENLKALIADQLCAEPEEICLLDTFTDLGLDSLDHAELIMDCEEQFGIEIAEDEAAGCKTVAGLYDIILRAQGTTLD